MDTAIEDALAAARAHHYLTKAQAIALADEVARLHEEIARLCIEVDNLPVVALTQAREQYIHVVETEYASHTGGIIGPPRGIPTRYRVHCDVCGEDHWDDAVWMGQ